MRLAGLIRSTDLSFVAKRHEAGDIYSFRFKPARPPEYLAGQHGLFTIPGLPTVRPFSLASAPEEPEIMIATHVRPQSVFKQKLAGLEPGDTVRMRGPIMDFVFEPDYHDVVMLAQGIGITPFRSMLLHANQAGLTVTTTLLHVDSAEHTFQSETKLAATSAFYPSHADEFTERLRTVVTDHPQARYYVSGGSGFLKSTKASLHDSGVSRNRIVTDWFFGY